MLGIGFASQWMSIQSVEFRKCRYIFRNKLAPATSIAGSRELDGNITAHFSIAGLRKLNGNITVRKSGTKRLGGIYDSGHQFQRTYGSL